MGLQLLNLFTHTVDALLIYYFLIKSFQKRSRINGEKIYLIVLIVINFLISLLFGYTEFVSYVLIVIISTLVYSYLLNDKIIKILIYTISGTIIMSVIEIITVGIIVLLFNIKFFMIFDINIYRIIAIIISKFIFYLTIKYLNAKSKIPVYSKIKNFKSILLILVFNIFLIFMLVSLFQHIQMDSIKQSLYLIVMILGMSLFSIMIYGTIKKSIYQNQQETIWKIKEEEFYKNDFYMNSMKDILETIKSQRHDLNNYLSTLYGLIYLQKFDDAKKYIGEINDEINNLNVIIDTNNPIITALVSIKKNKAFENGIDMNLDIEIPEDMDFEFVDLSIVVGNLLDNAIEACGLIPKDEKRIIDFKMYIKEEILRIEIKNTKIKSGKINIKDITSRFTTKSNDENHGYGLGNVEFVVKQYNGNMEIIDIEDEFRINIDLPMEKQNKVIA